MWSVYCISNLINNKVYIGKTGSLRKRKNSHLCKLREGTHYNSHLQRAWNKYKEFNFKIEIIDSAVTELEIYEMEKYYIKLANSHLREFGYNLTYGGEGGTFTQEVKDRMSKRLKGVPKSEEHKRKIGSSNKGKNSGKKLSENHVEKIRYSLFQQVQSDETKKKRALKQTGSGNHRFGKCGALSASYGKPNINRREVCMYDVNFNLIKTFNSIKEVGDYFNISSSSIHPYCKHGKIYKKTYYFRFKNEKYKAKKEK